jgi:uncharacterized protein (DUF1697 family)
MANTNQSIKYVAFLRGINVPGRLVRMSELRNVLTNAGLLDVKTILQTGNVTFLSKLELSELKDFLEEIISKAFYYPAKVQVMTISSLEIIAKDYPFEEMEGSHDYVIFAEGGMETYVTKEDFKLTDNEQMRLGRGVIYWQVEKGDTLTTSFAKMLNKTAYKQHITNRNLKTINKILKS